MICAYTAQKRAHYNSYSPYPSRSAGEARPGIVQRVCECSFGWIESDGYYLPVTFFWWWKILQFNHTQDKKKSVSETPFSFLFLFLLSFFFLFPCVWLCGLLDTAVSGYSGMIWLFCHFFIFLFFLWLNILHIPPFPKARNWVYLVMYGWPQQVGQASAAVSRLCEAAVVTNLSTQPHSWEFLEVHLSVVDRAALACWDDVCLWVVCPVRGTFPPPLVDSGAVCTTGPPRPSHPLGLRCAENPTLTVCK